MRGKKETTLKMNSPLCLFLRVLYGRKMFSVSDSNIFSSSIETNAKSLLHPLPKHFILFILNGVMLMPRKKVPTLL